MSTPGNLSPDQRELIDVLEKIAQLPMPIDEDGFVELADEALDLLEARGGALRGIDQLTIDDLERYMTGFHHSGLDLAAEGTRRLIERWTLEVADIARNN